MPYTPNAFLVDEIRRWLGRQPAVEWRNRYQVWMGLEGSSAADVKDAIDYLVAGQEIEQKTADGRPHYRLKRAPAAEPAASNKEHVDATH